MLVSRVFSSAWRGACRSALLLPPSLSKPLPVLSNQFDALSHETPCKALVLSHSTFSSSLLRRFGISSSASPEPSEKDQGSTGEKNGASADAPKAGENAKGSNQGEGNATGKTKVLNQAGNSDADSEGDEELSMEDLVKLVSEKEELLKLKHKQIEEMQDKVLRTYAEMENVMDRTRREAENAKKYAIQSFAKSLLDVADNLGRASSVVKESFAKIDASKDTTGAVPLLKTLLEGVEMTQKQLLEVFKKSGIEKYDPVNEPFDPHRHNAVFQMQDDSKPPGTVAVVLKPGYMLYERVLRPAEVGVIQAAENDTQG